ncbi:CRISPR-associated endonuclease Cas2, partial [Anaerotignum sp.]
MLQFSVYARVCNGNDAVKKHESRLKASLPPNGSIRLLVVTEKQY